LKDGEQGCHKSRYEQHEKTDVTKLPLPRIDLLKVDRYMFGSLHLPGLSVHLRVLRHHRYLWQAAAAQNQ
jgi:hypothetical protein